VGVHFPSVPGSQSPIFELSHCPSVRTLSQCPTAPLSNCPLSHCPIVPVSVVPVSYRAMVSCQIVPWSQCHIVPSDCPSLYCPIVPLLQCQIIPVPSPLPYGLFVFLSPWVVGGESVCAPSNGIGALHCKQADVNCSARACQLKFQKISRL
jgi:hypothetical protein